MITHRKQDLDVGDVAMGAGQFGEPVMEVAQVGAPQSDPRRMSISFARVRARSWRFRSARRVERRISSAVAAARTQTTDSTSSTIRRSRSERQGTIRIIAIITAGGQPR